MENKPSNNDEEILLELRRIECRHEDNAVVKGLSFRVRRGNLVCLLGPSGCGKTTVLRSIAGFQPLNAGEIVLRGEVVSRPGLTVPPEQRGLGMVFQDYALFPHLTVYDNIGFGLRKLDKAQRRHRADELLEIVDLAGLGARYPHELSGGQQQRVSLARAMAPRPELILLDEPFSSLDVDLRERLGVQMHDILKSQGITAVLVTHDQREAFAMADQIGVMRNGRVAQWDTPYNLYHEPADRFVADFIGQGRFISATLVAPDTLKTEVGLIKGDRAYGWEPGTEVDVLLRPDDVQPDPESELRATVGKKAFNGPQILYTLRLANGTEILGLFPSHMDYPPGTDVGLFIDAQHLIAFPRPDGTPGTP
ncbi:ABC transporter ATP-binding protein [Alkalilimnicola ehrlichii]|uniref:ABC transporter ATP-binding protein n=1 Tax=Alkalilimnicola ehrlichii TaxID=351052 RepID=A0A3E0WHP1_9GAMM|nr:ABC transporter ATP-binding protein [Alkalilimnicola ehrlichii]RFA24586.1 ABC transporter ATP-binding protein [Alkalilimnicola ehrlichii]RFA31681.1 ABC transporter ATP-binding protein [Alkalilimnicola ehrlichii]